eukprot:Hpha_TRINITY_DN12703_c0_g1::TRINITY_DN12703_c0_g1_i1::g.114611::m.114611
MLNPQDRRPRLPGPGKEMDPPMLAVSPAVGGIEKNRPVALWNPTAEATLVLLEGEPGLGGKVWDRLPVCCHTFHTMMYILCWLAAFASAVISGVGPASLTSIEDEWDLGPTSFAVAGIMYDAAQLLISMPVGVFGVNNIPLYIGVGQLFLIVGSLGSAAAPHFGVFLAAQALVGIGACPLWTLAQVHIDNSIRGDLPLVPKYISWYLMVTPLGVVLGFVLTGLLFTFLCTETETQAELHESCRSSNNITVTLLPPEEVQSCVGWRISFVACSLPLLLPSLWFIFSRKSYPDYLHAEDELLPADGREVLEALAAVPDAEKERKNSANESRRQSVATGGESGKMLIEALRLIVSNKRVLLVLLGQAAAGFTTNAILLFLPRFLERELCQSRSNAPLIFAGSVPVVAIGTGVGGWIPGRFGWGLGGQLVICFAGCIATSVCCFAFIFADNVYVFLCFILPGFFGAFLPASPSLSVLERLVDEEHRGVVMAVNNIAGRLLGSIPGPIFLGLLLETDGISTRAAYTSLSTLGFCSASLLYGMAWILHRREGGANITGTAMSPDFARDHVLRTLSNTDLRQVASTAVIGLQRRASQEGATQTNHMKIQPALPALPDGIRRLSSVPCSDGTPVGVSPLLPSFLKVRTTTSTSSAGPQMVLATSQRVRSSTESVKEQSV